MHLRSGVFMVPWLAALGACAVIGESAVQLESGNQPTGYLSRPLTLTASSDESVQAVAQRICDNVRSGSTARITFVGKVPGPDPVNLGDWGRYRYDCMARAVAPAAAASPAAVPAKVPLPAPFSAAPDPVQLRACLRQQGTYDICLGGCLVGSASPVMQLETDCRAQCAPQLPTGCH